MCINDNQPRRACNVYRCHPCTMTGLTSQKHSSIFNTNELSEFSADDTVGSHLLAQQSMTLTWKVSEQQEIQQSAITCMSESTVNTKCRGRPTKKNASEEIGVCTTSSCSSPFSPSPESQRWSTCPCCRTGPVLLYLFCDHLRSVLQINPQQQLLQDSE